MYDICRQQGFTPRIAHRVSEPQTALALVAGGYGITLLPENYACIGWPGVHFCRLSPSIPADLSVAYQPRSITPIAQAFIDLLRIED